jgi:hypothetical protein
MKDVFELDTETLSGPSRRGSLHAAVSLELNPHSGFVPDPPQVVFTREEPILLPLAKPLKARPTVSFVVSTFNRRDVLLKTLAEIDRCETWSQIVV